MLTLPAYTREIIDGILTRTGMYARSLQSAEEQILLLLDTALYFHGKGKDSCMNDYLHFTLNVEALKDVPGCVRSLSTLSHAEFVPLMREFVNTIWEYVDDSAPQA